MRSSGDEVAMGREQKELRIQLPSLPTVISSNSDLAIPDPSNGYTTEVEIREGLKRSRGEIYDLYEKNPGQSPNNAPRSSI